MARLGERILEEGVVRLFRFGNGESRLRHGLDVERLQQLGELADLAGIVRRDDDALHASAERWAWTSSAIPFEARSSSFDISSRVKGWPSAVPCTSTKWPAPVMTTFMSVSQPESSE